MAVDLPFKRPFRHAAASRSCSESLFVKCTTDTGAVGFGESLPRQYVTGETRDGAFELLQHQVLPRLTGLAFDSMPKLEQFLADCDGRAPAAWVDPLVSQTAAWCAVELALLDAFGRSFHQPFRFANANSVSKPTCFSGVISADSGWKFALSLLKCRVYGLKQIKLKAGNEAVWKSVKLARKWLGRATELRVDANMAWTLNQALGHLRQLRALGVHCLEQPLLPADLDGAARLVQETGAAIIADEGFYDAQSLDRLVRRRACTGLNVRISKCGGLVAAKKRCDEAARAGLTLQLGCQVGESSLLSAAQLLLLAAVPQARYLEGCFSTYLLREDPVRPALKFGYGGRRPELPAGPGLAVEVDENRLNQWVTQRASIKNGAQKQTQGKHHVDCSEVAVFSDRTNHHQAV